MKSKYILTIIALTITFCSCTRDSKRPAKKNKINSESNPMLDSLKWYFYAYTYQGKALFKKDNKGFQFEPVECDIVNRELLHKGDTITALFVYDKNGYSYQYVYEGMGVSGFNYFKGVAQPLTGMLVFDNFDNPEYLREDNLRTDSAFISFLKTKSIDNLSVWLQEEVKKRKIFP